MPRRGNKTKGKKRGRRRTKRKQVPEVDIGILTIRDDEFAAVLSAFPEKDGTYKGLREYALRVCNAGGGQRYRVAILRQLEQGNGEAQDAARDLIEDLDPSLMLVVGIAGAVPSSDYTLGDVVVATRVNDYSVEARRLGEDPTYNLSGGPIAKAIASGVANLAAREDELGPWNQGLPSKPTVSWKKKGDLYGPHKWKKKVRDSMERHFGAEQEPRAPLFVSGAIASSDRLVKDPLVLFPWLNTARHILAVEMESAGVYRAARDRCPMLAIRGLSDVVGLKRDDAWTKYACESAASFANAYLHTTPVEPRSPELSEEEGESDAEQAEPRDLLFANLLPIVSAPSTVFIAPAKYGTYKQTWAALLDETDGGVRNAWTLNGGNIYSLIDLASSELACVADLTAVEEHDLSDFRDSEDPAESRLFVYLMKGALRDDLFPLGVRYFRKDDVFSFVSSPDAEPLRITYQSLRRRSTIKAVAHYSYDLKDGTSVPFLRHMAFKPRFRRFGKTWFLQFTPTYRFTTDGMRKYRFHEAQLKGIKKLERNRAVLSQVLVWEAVLCRQVQQTADPPEPLLRFAPSPNFAMDGDATEREWSLSANDAHVDAEAPR